MKHSGHFELLDFSNCLIIIFIFFEATLLTLNRCTDIQPDLNIDAKTSKISQFFNFVQIKLLAYQSNLELVPKELNHLAAILQHYAWSLIFMK